MQPCPTCQFESPLGAKFCRQCGAPLLTGMPAENELSGAATRNYGRQEPAFAPAGSAPLPPSISDVISSDTARYQQLPHAMQTPHAFMTPGANTAPMQRRFFTKGRHWRVLAFFLVLMVGIGLGLIFAHVNGEDPVTDPVELARMDAQAAEMARKQEMADRIREAQDRAREAQDRIREAEQRAREAAEQAAASGASLAPGDAKPLDLKEFEYPGAATGNYSRIPGSEMVQMRSKDSFDTILQHYQKKLGKPLMLMTDDDDKSAFFQSTAAPAVFVSIENDEDNDGFWKITITRAPFQFHQPDAPKPPTAPAKP